MSDISRGPVSSMPGSLSSPPAGAMCDDHPEVPAYKRVQGETDSFGCEYHDLCDACVIRIAAALREEKAGVCSWCNSQAQDLRPHRDLDEGMAGPIYQVCRACRDKEAEALIEELMLQDPPDGTLFDDPPFNNDDD